MAIIFFQPTSAFTVAPLVARKVERLVGISFFLAVPSLIPKGKGLAESTPRCRPPDQSDLSVRLSSLFQRQGSGDPTPCGGYPGPACWALCFLTI